jgi:hypothetical protein
MVFFAAISKSIGVCVTRSVSWGGFKVCVSVSLTTSPVCASAPFTSIRSRSSWNSQPLVVCPAAGAARDHNIAAPIAQAKRRSLIDIVVVFLNLASIAQHLGLGDWGQGLEYSRGTIDSLADFSGRQHRAILNTFRICLTDDWSAP